MRPRLPCLRVVAALSILAVVAVAGGCSAAGSAAAGGSHSGGASALSAQAALGEKIFRDASLSASGRLSCASCHDAGHAFATADGLATPLGGPALDAAGIRNAPSLRYGMQTPAFHFAADGIPTGGFDRDGRADALAEQARRPFLTPFEMANASALEVADRLSRASYAADFRALYGRDIFSAPEDALERALLAIQRYEQEDTADFAPYTSKYDAFLAGKLQLTTQELTGLALFNAQQKGNCAACHPSSRGTNGAAPLFTDLSYDNLGVPRNPGIPANANPAYFDLGLCGPARTDLADRADLCGAFKVPTLRNVALTAPHFHNGRFQTLREVVSFYVRRDTHPKEWYPLGSDGLPRKFDDLPPQYVVNVNTTEVPYNRRPGDQPALDPAEIDAVVAFLNSLTDGYHP